MYRYRFNLRSLFFAATLISFGLALAVLPFSRRIGDGEWYFYFLPQLLWLSGGMLVGGGLLLPFAKCAVGAVLGFTVQVVVFYTWFVPLSRLF